MMMNHNNDVQWDGDGRKYPDHGQLQSFIHELKAMAPASKTFDCPDMSSKLQGNQRVLYDAVHHHHSTTDPNPLRIICKGVAGTG